MTDTAAKRNSALHFLRRGVAPLFPDAILDQDNRQSAIHSYGGILGSVGGTGIGNVNDQTIWLFFDEEIS